MTLYRNLVTIAAVPGFRANTMLVAEVNFVPKPKAPPLDVYADLKVVERKTARRAPKDILEMFQNSAPSKLELEQVLPRKPVKVSDLDLKKRLNYEDTREQYLRERMNNPNASGLPVYANGLHVDLKNNTVFYKGKWWTDYEANKLSSIERNKLADAYIEAKRRQLLEQPKARSIPRDYI